MHGESSELDQIGIPQGGALSGFIANAVLHRADKSMKFLCEEQDVTYLRYCDDIIVIASSEASCARAFKGYCKCLEELKLPIHKPVKVDGYQGSNRRAFWNNAKSKQVYRWDNPAVKDACPWVQFLGYQIRYDGAVRVRQSSIHKEMEKLARKTDRVLGMLTQKNAQNLRKSSRSIEHRTRMRLISMAVGRRGLLDRDEPAPKCWASGFRWLSGKNILIGNLKSLDRQRERQVNRVARRLDMLRLNPPKREKDQVTVLKRYGRPFSYWGQFKKVAP